jgi:hypothetical protein
VVLLIELAKRLLLIHHVTPDSLTTECLRGHPLGPSSIVYRAGLVHLVSLVYLGYLAQKITETLVLLSLILTG